MPSRRRQLDTFDDVVNALGGPGRVGEMCDDQESAAVCNWKRRRGVFPTKFYKVMKEQLDAIGCEAPDHLWGFYERREAADAA